MKLIYTITIGLLIYGCCDVKSPTVKNQTDLLNDTSLALLADTIIYDVVIKNPDPEDTWTAYCLKKLDYSQLVDNWFNRVYTGELTAYDDLTNLPMNIKEIKKIEDQSDFSRDKIGKIQFTESWNYNPNKTSIEKKTLAVALGYEVYDDEGNIRGYKPVFKIWF